MVFLIDFEGAGVRRLLTLVLLIGRGSREDGTAACFGLLDLNIMILGYWFGVMEFKEIPIMYATISIRPGYFAYLFYMIMFEGIFASLFAVEREPAR